MKREVTDFLRRDDGVWFLCQLAALQIAQTEMSVSAADVTGLRTLWGVGVCAVGG